MDSFDRDSTYELSNNLLIFDKLTSNIIAGFSSSEDVTSGRSFQTTTVAAAAAVINPTVVISGGSSGVASANNLLQKITETFLSAVALIANGGGGGGGSGSSNNNNNVNDSSNNLNKFQSTLTTEIQSTPEGINRMDLLRNHVIIDSSSFEPSHDLHKQLDYDKFMNEVWIGVVLTLIIISMVFCFCSCFLYHQFKQWKRSYHQTVAQSNSQDIESMKLNPDIDDPVPEYTLVSGLPSYEAAIELLRKTRTSCLIVYPSLCNLSEKVDGTMMADQEMSQSLNEVITASVPLMTQPTFDETKLGQEKVTEAITATAIQAIPSYEEATSSNRTNNNNNNTRSSQIKSSKMEQCNFEESMLLKC